MKKLLLSTAVVLASHAGGPSAASDALFEADTVPLDPYLQCRAHAVKVYDLPPRLAISLGCEQELEKLEGWMVEFATRTGLTIGEVEFIIGKTTPR